MLFSIPVVVYLLYLNEKTPARDAGRRPICTFPLSEQLTRRRECAIMLIIAYSRLMPAGERTHVPPKENTLRRPRRWGQGLWADGTLETFARRGEGRRGKAHGVRESLRQKDRAADLFARQGCLRRCDRLPVTFSLHFDGKTGGWKPWFVRTSNTCASTTPRSLP